MTVYRSFRLFGDFEIAYTTQGAAKKENMGNVFELFHAPHPKGDNNKLYTFARICDINEYEFNCNPPESPPTENNIFLKAYQNKLIEEKENNVPISFWACSPLNADSKEISNPNRLFSSKVICLDQFCSPKSNVPTERIPLLPVYTHNDGNKYNSGVSFDIKSYLFKKKTFHIKLELGIPLPGLDDTAGDGTGFAYGGLYETCFEDIKKIIIASDIYFGKEKKEIKTKEKLFNHGFSVEIKTNLIRALGIEKKNKKNIFGFFQIRSTPYKQSDANKLNEDSHFLFAIAMSTRYIDSKGNKYGLKEDISLKTLNTTDQLGALLSMGKIMDEFNGKFTAEFYWRTLITDNSIREALNCEEKSQPEKLDSKVHAQLIWKDKLPSGIETEPQQSDESLILSGGGLDEVARLSNVARQALTAVQRQPQSILPELSTTNGEDIDIPLIAYPRNLEIEFSLGEAPCLKRIDAHLHATARYGITLDTKHDKRDESRLLLDGAEDDMKWQYARKIPEQVALRLRLPGFNISRQDNNTQAHDHVCLSYDYRIRDEKPDYPDISMLVQNDTEKQVDSDDHIHEGTRRVFQLGSLVFESTQKCLLVHNCPINDSNVRSTDSDVQSTLSIRRRDRQHRDKNAPNAPTLDIEWNLALAIDTAKPVTTDIPHGQREDRPEDLLIEEKALEANDDQEDSQQDEASFVLEVRERLRDDQDRLLEATLTERKAGQNIRQVYTVINQLPFTIYRFIRQPLADSGRIENPEVAHYSSDEKQWKMLKASDTYMFIRQAGSVGENADKPGRLEIRDCGREKPNPVNMRLSPPTTVWVKPSDLARNYFLPEYAGRELFRQQNDFGIGMRLSGLRFELLYGLSAGLIPPAPSIFKPASRIAEIKALTGNMVPSDGTGSNNCENSRWTLLRCAFEYRSERLEVWTFDPARLNPFVPASFDQGLTFALRQTALLYPPTDVTPDTLNKNSSVKHPSLHESGLAGGALWPVESANVLRVLLENPVATGGTLDNIALSPTGDSGDQTVHFLNRYATIISETREGRLNRHRVEIMGRIGVLWHRAKHVVVYERTTAPSAQFAPINKPERTRRPVLRKVDEFIEILEPMRSYPDTSNASTRSCGCIEAVRFNSRIIRVNSSWGKDLGKTGWEVPLWNRGEAGLRPQVYPYPDVAFITTGEGKARNAQAVQECLDVAKLYFYTDPEAAKEYVNSDDWPARASVDFSRLGNHETLKILLEKKLLDSGNSEDDQAGDSENSKDDKKGQQLPASLSLPGLGRFTWRLAPAAIRTRINAARGKKPIFAGLESVSMMRQAAKDEKNEQLFVHTLCARKKININGLISDAPDAQIFPFNSDNQVLSGTGSIIKVLKQHFNSSSQNKDEIKATLNKLKEQIDKEPLKNGQLEQQFKKFFGDKGLTRLEEIKTFSENGNYKNIYEKIKESDATLCEGLKQRTANLIRQRKLLCLEMLRQAETETISYLVKLEADSVKLNAKRLRTELDTSIKRTTRGLFSGVSSGIADIQNGLSTAHSIIHDWHAETLTTLERGEAKIDDFHAAYIDNKPWSRQRLDNALRKFEQTMGAAKEETFALIDQTSQRLSTEIDRSIVSIGARITTTLARTVALKQKALDLVKNTEALFEQAKNQVKKGIDALPDKDKLKNLEGKLKCPSGDSGNVCNKLKDALTKLNGTEGETIDDLKLEMKKRVDKIAANVNDSLGKINENIETIKNTFDNLEKALDNAKDDPIIDDEEIKDEIEKLYRELDDFKSNKYLQKWDDWSRGLELAINDSKNWLNNQKTVVKEAAESATKAADDRLSLVQDEFKILQKGMLKDLERAFETQVTKPAIDDIIQSIDWDNQAKEVLKDAKEGIRSLSFKAEKHLKKFTEVPLDSLDDAKEICKQLVGYKDKIINQGKEFFKNQESALKPELERVNKSIQEAIDSIKPDVRLDEDKIKNAITVTENLLDTTNEIVNQAAEAGDHAKAYLDRGVEIIEKFDDASPGQLPGLALQLISAATKAPEIAALKVNADRIRVLFDEANDVLKTTKLKGMLDQLGDALKAIGLEFEFDEFSDTFNIKAPGNKVGELIPDFGGIKLNDLFPDTNFSNSLSDPVKVSHDIDTTTGRAWVRADINAPLQGRQPLFSLGPFVLYLTDSLLTAFIRAEASKDKEDAEVRDHAALKTTIEAVVAGQVMVKLKDVLLTYSSTEKLNFNIDPSKIQIHSALRFIEDTLGSIIGDNAGALKFIKEKGIPIGVEQEISLPPISIMSGTSGVQNLQIANSFSLRAYPDFIIANRFNLSRRELPFIFSVFIIGGSGYIRVDTEYRPFDKSLVVVVEASAGGSASLGFALGPISGAVFISLSIALRYYKSTGKGSSLDNGLSVSSLLVLAGNFSLWGIATVFIAVILSMSYHENGRIDALGQLSVEVRVSRWFKLKYSTQVRYRLRGEGPRKVSSSSRSVEKLEKLRKLDKARQAL